MQMHVRIKASFIFFKRHINLLSWAQSDSLSPAAETMLKLVEFCRKFETEQEKVLPFFSPSHEPGTGDELPEFPEELMDPGRAAAAAVAKAAAEEAEMLAGPSDPNKPKLSSHGVDDKGKEVEEWDYLNRLVTVGYCWLMITVVPGFDFTM